MSATREDIQQLIAATGKYKLEAENTEGANAYAFRAHHLPLDQPVFLKVLDAASDGDLFAEPRLLLEATKSVGNDSNLVRVYDAQRLGREYVLVAMEYVEGGSILSRLGSGPLPLMEAVGAAVGILHGLAQLHQALLVHRDIKPANVLLSRRYGRIWSKITDFGSVARLTHAEASVWASRHSALYVPPEGWATPSRYDVRSDLYQVALRPHLVQDHGLRVAKYAVVAPVLDERSRRRWAAAESLAIGYGGDAVVSVATEQRLVLFEMAHGSLPYNDEAYLDRDAKRELQELAPPANGIAPFDRNQVVDRALARAASGKGVTAFGKIQPYVPQNLARIINRAIAPDSEARYQKPSDMIGDLEALRFPDWRPVLGSGEYAAHGWSGWDWAIEQDTKKPRQWVVLRRRQAANRFRRWATATSARAACRLVKEAAA